MPRTKKGSASERTSDETDSLRYIRETVTELEGAFDQEAVWLICGEGIFCVDDPAKIGEAVPTPGGARDHPP